jgi:hypothetical protein
MVLDELTGIDVEGKTCPLARSDHDREKDEGPTGAEAPAGPWVNACREAASDVFNKSRR